MNRTRFATPTEWLDDSAQSRGLKAYRHAGGIEISLAWAHNGETVFAVGTGPTLQAAFDSALSDPFIPEPK